MTGTFRTLSLILLALPLPAIAADQLIPAGALVQCTITEPHLSSKTADVGDPVLCRINRVELPGRSAVPYGSYLVGRFEDYKDPGHLVGKGWMELKFDRLVLPPDTVIGFSAKVVDVPKYPVDKLGRIHGTGHAVRDTVEWLIPVLWPIDLINLPRRGPRPVLKAETRLTLKIMDDIEVPLPEQQMAQGQPALVHRAPMVIEVPPSQDPDPQPIRYEAPQPPAPVRVQPAYQASRPLTLLVMRNGYGMYAVNYWLDERGSIRYTATNGAPVVMSPQQLDLPSTVEANRRRGVEFDLRPQGY